MFSLLPNFLNVSDVKVVSTSEIIFSGSPNSSNVILVVGTRSYAERLATLFYNWELAVIIYNTKKGFVINHKYVSTNYILGFVWYFIVYCCFLWLFALIF